ncbi:TPA: tyrosine-type recombinase/integrase [Staphylococcus pseudintermedius]|nr:tyrosine-type recombinase/integrase [Staphylococcus pseudintermedius]
MRVYKRKKKWGYDIHYKNKRYRKVGFKTKKEAQSAGNVKYQELTKGIDSDSKIAFANYSLDWIQVYKKEYVSDKTYKDYERIQKRIEKFFGDIEINKVTREQYQKFLTHHRELLSQDQLGRISAVCKKIVASALYDGLVTRDFTLNSQVISRKVPKKLEIDKFLNIDELKEMKKYFENKVEYLAPSTHIILVMIETGGRFSDCINMKKEDINQIKGELFLNGTKNDNAPRYVSVSKKLIQILMNYIANRPTSLNGYIFTHAGKQITNSSVNKAIKTACNTLNIKRNITSHAFRHTHASYLIHKGVNIYYISNRLGHSDISVTLNKYGHLLKEAQKEEELKTLDLIQKI